MRGEQRRGYGCQRATGEGWAGRLSGPNKLTGSYIFNDNGLDGVRVKTNVTTYTKHC